MLVGSAHSKAVQCRAKGSLSGVATAVMWVGYCYIYLSHEPTSMRAVAANYELYRGLRSTEPIYHYPVLTSSSEVNLRMCLGIYTKQSLKVVRGDLRNLV